MKKVPLCARGSAFTLIEILVIVGILALLSALLFPVFSRVRENARKTSCMSNLKQLGLAFQQYTQDAGGRYPLPGNYFAGFVNLSSWVEAGNWITGPDAPAATSNVAEPNAPFNWTGKKARVAQGALFPYTKSESVYVCPSNGDGNKKGFSYSMNCALTGLNTVRVRTPAEIVLLVDEEYANDGYFYAVHDPIGAGASPKSGASGTPTASTDLLTKRHNGGGNLLFADGHVEYISFDRFPLDDTEGGMENKWRDTGVPRFHDPSFGPFGSSIKAGVSAPDYCNATTRTP